MTTFSFRQASIVELGALLRARHTTSTELTQEALRLLETDGAALNAVSRLTRERALHEADQADHDFAVGIDRGPLHGIPYGAKDLLDTQAIATTYGSPTHDDRVPTRDAVVIERLRRAGAVLVAKLSMVPLAGGGGYPHGSVSVGGPIYSPWSAHAWAGGSSSGSGAAVGAGLVPFALGSETWGSIVCPASFCGVTGLRPTFGLVPTTGAMVLSWTLDKLGPLARSAEDCGIVLAAMVNDERTTHPEWLPAARRLVAGQRMGIVPENYAAYAEPEIEPLFRAAVAALEQCGMTANEIVLPDYPYGAVASVICTCEAVAAFDDLVRSPRLRALTTLEQQSNLLAGLAISAADYVRAQRIRAAMQHDIAALLMNYDVLVAPALLGVAPDVAQNFAMVDRGDGASGALGNLCGLPSISVPMGFGRDHLPVDLEIIGAPGTEQRLLDVAAAFQSVTDWHRQYPPTF